MAAMSIPDGMLSAFKLAISVRFEEITVFKELSLTFLTRIVLQVMFWDGFIHGCGVSRKRVDSECH